jgi:hypothetical protein
VRRIVAEAFLSLDGVTEDPGRFGEYEHRGWTVPYWSDGIEKWHADQLFQRRAAARPGDLREFVAIWPRRRPDEARQGLRSGDPFTDRMNSLPKFVASTTLQEPLEWNSTLLAGEVAEAVADLKEQPARTYSSTAAARS